MCAMLVMPAIAQKKSPSKKSAPPASTAAAPSESPAIKSLPLGSPIPNMGAPLMGIKPGELVTLGQAKTENGLLVMFSCNTCPFVVKSQRRTRDMMELTKTLKVGFVIINSNEAKRSDEDSYDAMRRYALAQQYSVPYLRDDASMMANIFGATRTPEVFLFDGEGKLVYKGAMEDNPSDYVMSRKIFLKDALEAMTSKKPIQIAETKSIGCSIKRMEM